MTKSQVWRQRFENDCIVSDCEPEWAREIAEHAGEGIIGDDLWNRYENKHDLTGLIFGLVSGTIILVLLSVVLAPWVRNWLCPQFSFWYCCRQARQTNIKNVFPLELFLDSARITCEKKIASGAFGTIYKGSFARSSGQNYKIALKTIRLDVENGREKDRDRLELLKKEGVKMRDFDHKHVLSLKGIVELNRNFCLVFKWMENGALNSYLKKNKSCPFRQLLSFCRDISDGMAYLASKNVYHRDLAARNCLVDGDLLVKVADFGLSRAKNDQAGHFSKRNSMLRNLPLPVKWMSPESLKLHFFDERTDVWSFGIVTWEIMSRGAVPFPKAPGDPNLFFDYLKRGNRPKQPQNCPDDIFQIIKTCLEDDKWKRATFLELKAKFEEKLQEYPTPPPRNNSLNHSRLGSWRVPPQSRHDSLVTIPADELQSTTDRPPPYSAISQSAANPIHSYI